MGQAAVERCIGRLLTDDMWRHRFGHDPDATLDAIAQDTGVSLTPAEHRALRAMPVDQWERLAGGIDPRLQRVGPSAGGAR